MKLKLVLLLFIVMAMVPSIYSECIYLENHSSCDFTTTQGLNIITFNTQDVGNYESITVEVFTPQGDSYLLEEAEDLSTSDTASFYQPSIFNSYGVYTYDVEIVLDDESTTISRTYTLLYDNSNPLPPVIESVDEQNGNLEVSGFVNFANLVNEVKIYNNGILVETKDMSENSDFTFVISNPNDGTNYIELKSINSNGESLKNHYMHYSQDFDPYNIELARITSVDFASNNENIKDQGSRIVTTSPIHHISGTASDGNIVFAQGVPIPVVDGEFQAVLYLNEGDETVCVYGSNQNCQSFTTIYSYANNRFTLNTNDIDDINFNTLDTEEYISKMRVQGKELTTSKDFDISDTPLNRSIYFVEIVAPGIYENNYIIKDREDPKIEILSQSDLFSSSQFAVKFSDDIGVDLSTLVVRIGSTTYTYDDSIDTQSLGRVNYALFSPPEISQSNIQIEAYIEDTSGNSITRTKWVSINNGISSNNISVNVLSGHNIVGNQIYTSDSDETITFSIKDAIGGEDMNKPIALDIPTINDLSISDYTIKSDNEIVLNVDLSQLESQNEYDLTIPVLIYSDINNNNPETINLQYTIINPLNHLEANKNFRVIERHLSNDIVIVELLNDMIDTSTIRVDSSTDSYFSRGDYIFVRMDGENERTLSYLEMDENSRSFAVNNQRGDIDLMHITDSDLYSTFKLDSLLSDNVYSMDLLSSKRGDNIVSIPSETNIHMPSAFLEGLSVLENSVVSTDSRISPTFKTPTNEYFSFSNYPTISRDGNEVFYRGKKKHVPESQDEVIIQGRVLGNEDIQRTVANEVQCQTEKRFFICELQRDNYVGKELDLRFFDTDGDEIFPSYNTLLLRMPTDVMNLGTQLETTVNINATYVSKDEDGNIAREDVTQNIACSDTTESSGSYNYNFQNGNLTVERESQDAVAVGIECQVEYKNLNAIESYDAFFEEIPSDERLVLTVPDSIDAGEVESIGPLELNAYNYRGDDLTDQIQCNSQNNDIQVRMNSGDGNLEVIRSVNSTINAVINCGVSDTATGLTTDKSFSVQFAEILGPSPLSLQTSDTLMGEEQESIITDIIALHDNFDITSSRVSCIPSDSQITLNEDFDNNRLEVTRTSDSSIESSVTCSVSNEGFEETSNIEVYFDSINNDNSYDISFNTPSRLSGNRASNVQHAISAIGTHGQNLTSRISCTDNGVQAISISQSHSPLIIERTTNNSIDTVIQCSVENNGYSKEKNIRVTFEEITNSDLDEVVSIFAQSPLQGQQNDEVIGTIEGRLNNNLILTSQIVCISSDNNLYDYNIESQANELKITRQVNDSINSELECSVSNQDNTITDSTTIKVLFDEKQDPNNQPDPISVDISPSPLSSDSNRIIANIYATKNGNDVLDEIICEPNNSSFSASINRDNHELTLTRNTNDSIDSTISCKKNSNNEVLINTPVKFTEILDPPSPLSLLTSSPLLGGEEQSTTTDIKALYDNFDITSQVSCIPSDSQITLNEDFDNNRLEVIRTSDSSIESSVTCSVSNEGFEETSNIEVYFDSINNDNSYDISFNTPSRLSGNRASNVQHAISAIDTNGQNLTSSISCTDNGVQAISISQSHSPLIIERTTDNLIDTVIQCSVENNGYSKEKNIRVTFEEITNSDLDEVVSIFAQSPLQGQQNDEVIGNIEGRLNNNLILTSQIVCTTPDNNLYDYNINGDENKITITRQVNDSINSELECSVSNQDNTITDSTTITVLFDDKHDPNNQPDPISVDIFPSPLFSDSNRIIANIDATRNGNDVLDEIICEPNNSSFSASINRDNHELTLTRNTNDSIDSTISCKKNSNNAELIHAEVEFAEILTIVEQQIIFNVPEILNLGTLNTAEQKLTARIGNDHINSEIQCDSRNNRVDTSMFPNNENSILEISRKDNTSVSDTIDCEVRDVQKSIVVGFNKIDSIDDISLFRSFPSTTMKYGTSQGGEVNIHAEGREGEDITDQISCISTSSSVSVSPASPNKLKDTGSLSLQRNTDSSISGNIECSVSYERDTEDKSFSVEFDTINDVPIVPEEEDLELSIDTENSNLLTFSEPYHFEKGKLQFTIEPLTTGQHEVYINGELIKTIQFSPTTFELNEEDYLNSDIAGQELEIYVKDENDQSSNSLRLRFSRILEALLQIVVN